MATVRTVASRPMKALIAAGRLWRAAGRTRNAGNDDSDAIAMQLEQQSGLREALQAVVAKFDEGAARWERRSGEQDAFLRDEHLSSVRPVTDPRRPVDRLG